MRFLQKLESTVKKNNSLLCIGLDTDIEKIPRHLLTASDAVFIFNKAIIDATRNFVCSYKINIAFYNAQGITGLQSLQKTINYIHVKYTSIPVILDAKRADIGNTSAQYVKEVFDFLEADAVTVNPYLGFDSLEPFFQRKDKGIFVLCRTSNPGASDFQNTEVSIAFHLGGGNEAPPRENCEPLYLTVARKVVEWNKTYKNCLLVIGATAPDEMRLIREIAPNIFFLVPGIGSQGGDLIKTLKLGLTKEKSGLIINVSRDIIYASNDKSFPQKAAKRAREIKEDINKNR